jgi:hypothetical protein
MVWLRDRTPYLRRIVRSSRIGVFARTLTIAVIGLDLADLQRLRRKESVTPG